MTNRQFTESIIEDKLGIFLDSKQLKAVTAPYGINIITAGPGSGKSTVIMCRIFFLIYVCGTKPENITVIVFNRSAKEGILRRIQAACTALGIELPHVFTIHGFCRYILITNRTSLNIREITNTADIETIKKIQELYMRFTGNTCDRNRAESICNSISEYINTGSFGDNKSKDTYCKMLTRIMNISERDRMTRGILSYDDLQKYALKENYKTECLLVDETQDITDLQFRIITKVFIRDLFMVGDDDQSVYGFRYASGKYLINPSKYFKEYRVFGITCNYRSCGAIVDISSRIIEKNKYRVNKNITWKGAYGCYPEIVYVSRRIDQYRYIRDIYRTKKSEETMCVVFRNNESSIQLTDFLCNCGIYPCVSGKGKGIAFVNEAEKLTKRIISEKKSGDVPLLIVRHIIKTESKDIRNDDILSNIEEISGRCKTVEELCERLDTLKKVFDGTLRGDVILSSFHAVKGSEYDIVVLVDMNVKRFPIITKDECADKQLEAERRLLYVGLTRAKKRAFILVPGKYETRSLFVTEIEEATEKAKKTYRFK